MIVKKLEASIPANNWKIVELYNKIRSKVLDPSPFFQRKLVWKRQHKINFIETILSNFPFPEIYIAPGEMDTDNLTLKDLIVDGQQRCSTIVNYIEGNDVFASSIPCKKFSELTKEEKSDFLNYEVSVRYLKNASDTQIKSIFQRINSTDYALNKTERLNAQWGDSEFICFAKQVIEPSIDLDWSMINYKLKSQNRDLLLKFFHDDYLIFSFNDINRMLALQYVLTLVATLIEKDYFKRNDKVQYYIELYNEEFIDAAEIEIKLVDSVKFIKSLELTKGSYWFNKANIFTLIVELSKFSVEEIDADKFKEYLLGLENEYRKYTEVVFFGIESGEERDRFDNLRYFEVAREAVNELWARDYRGKVINAFIQKSLTGVEDSTIDEGF